MKRILFILLLHIPIIVSGQSVKSDSLYSIGVDLYSRGKYIEASDIFKQVVDLDIKEIEMSSPRQYYGQMWLASCYYRLGETDEARKYYPADTKPIDRRITIQSDSLLAESIEKARQQNYNEALNLINEASAIEHNICSNDNFFHVGTYHIKAEYLFALKDFTSAKECLADALKIQELYLSMQDTLLLQTLDQLYITNIHLKDYDSAEEMNDYAYKIIEANYNQGHIGYATSLHRKLALAMYRGNQYAANSELPRFIDALLLSHKDDKESILNALYVLRADLEQCSFYDECKLVTEVILTQSDDYEDKIGALSLQYIENLNNPDNSDNLDHIESELIKLTPNTTPAIRKSHIALLECLRISRYIAQGEIEKAKTSYLLIQKNDLEKFLTKGSIAYYVFLASKHNIALVLSDYESSINALSEYLEIIPKEHNDYLFYKSMLACSYSFCGDFTEANRLTQEIVSEWKMKNDQGDIEYRMKRDDSLIKLIATLLNTHISHNGDTTPEIRYNLREILSEYLLLDIELHKNKNRYQIDTDYYDSVQAYIIELLNMKKYAEALNAIDSYLDEWHKCYEQIDDNSENQDDIIDKIVAYIPYGQALHLKRYCYDSKNKNAITAHQDYTEYIKYDYGDDSNEYIDAVTEMYNYTGEREKLREFLESYDELELKHYKTLSDIYLEKGDLTKGREYLKHYVCEAIKDNGYRTDSVYEWTQALNNVNKLYLDPDNTYDIDNTSDIMCFYNGTLWPSIFSGYDEEVELFIRSIYELDYEVKDAKFADDVKATVNKYLDGRTNYIIDACINQAIAGVLYSTNNYDAALNYIDIACDLCKKDKLLGLYFEYQKYIILLRSGQTSGLAEYGSYLFNRMISLSEFHQTAELHTLVEEHLKLLMEHGNHDEATEICQKYMKYFKSNEDSLINVYKKHPEYHSFHFLSFSQPHTSIFGWLDVINETMYEISLSKNSRKSKDYALSMIQDEYEHIKTGLNVNSMSSYRSDSFISLTTRLAYTHKTDTLKSCAYNAALLCKGMQMQSDFAIRKLIQESGHISALRKYDDLNHTLRLLANANENKIDSLYARRNVLRKDLFTMSRMFGEYQRSLESTWRDVKKSLDTDDIAIEFTYVEPSYFTPSIKEGYYACIIRPQMRFPDVVYLSEDIPNEISVYGDQSISQLIFGPLQQYMDGVKNIYFSPIKELNLLSIESLPYFLDSTKKMADEYNMYRVSSTREVINLGFKSDQGSEVVIYGGIKYDTPLDSLAVDSYVPYQKEENIDIRALFDKRAAVQGIQYLPGTLNEANKISSLLNGSKKALYRTEVFTGNKGTESSFKNLSGKAKRIIHIATHGFYIEDNNSSPYSEETAISTKIGMEDMAMLRSGLLFAGSDFAWRGDDLPDNIEDGILTAQEISSVDLSGLDLVVLSACETALGHINSEGVFGLQRAFKKAGAQSILMSLWKVDDKATEILMTEFYAQLMEGKSKSSSLEAAKQKLRNIPEYSDPVYWAAFVLLDGMD